MKNNNILRSTPAELYIVIVLFIVLALLNSNKAKGQCYQPMQTTTNGVFTYGGAGVTKGFFSGELVAGWRQKNISLAVGFNSIPNNTMPVLFQTRAGVNIGNRWHVYAAAVRVTYSSDDKSRNYNTWAVGLQYHTLHFDRGSIYYTAHYAPGFVGVGVGMSYNLMKED